MSSRLLSAAIATVSALMLMACGNADAKNDLASAAATASDPARDSTMARADQGRIKGDSSAKVWLIVVSDFQCPYCKVWHDETAPLIIRDYVDKGLVRIAYMNYPLSHHRNATPAHELAMCAAEQNNFWPVADAIFDTQGAWKGLRNAYAYFDSLATTLPLDQNRLKSCISSGHVRTLIQADFSRTQRIGIGSTPSFLVGNKVLVGAQPYIAFQQALNEALHQANNAAQP